MKLYVDGIEYEPTATEAKAVAVEMWYDHLRREWVLYPVDSEGNQLEGARYAFNKKEALGIKRELKAEHNL